MLLDIATGLTESALRDFLDGYANPSGEIQGDPATIAAEAAAAGLVEREDEPSIEDDAILLYRDKITVKHDDYIGRPPMRWIIEELIAIGSVPSVTGCEHETVIEFEIPVKSLWLAAEMVQELDVALAGYGVRVKEHPFGMPDGKLATDVWRNTCNEAMRLMYGRDEEVENSLMYRGPIRFPRR